MAITPVAAGSTSAGIGDTTPGLPSGWAAGDYHILFVESYDEAVTAPSGWTQIGNGTGWTNGEAEVAVYGRVRDGSEGSSVTISLSGSANVLGFCAAYSGVSGPGNAGSWNNSNTLMETTPITATAQSCIIHVWAGSRTTSTTVTLPNAGDLIASVYNAGSTWFLGAENQFSVSAGTTTKRDAVPAAAMNWNAMQIELLKA